MILSTMVVDFCGAVQCIAPPSAVRTSPKLKKSNLND